MTESQPNASDLVLTQAELPPGIDAPAPPGARGAAAAGPGRSGPPARPPGLSVDLLREVRELADKVGGLDRLREIVDELRRVHH